MEKTKQQLAVEIEELKYKVALQAGEIEYLSQQVAFFNATKYAPKTEARKNQPLLFNEAESTAEPEADEHLR